MSVMIIIKFPVDSIGHAEKVMESNAEALDRLSRLGQSHGATHHAFYADIQANALVAIDEWESKEAFDAFFDGNREIEDLMAQAGVRGQPDVTVLEPMEIAGAF